MIDGHKQVLVEAEAVEAEAVEAEAVEAEADSEAVASTTASAALLQTREELHTYTKPYLSVNLVSSLAG